MARWHTDLPGADGLSVSVNLSPQQLVRGDLVDHVAQALADSGLPPSALTLEVTETGVVQDNTAAAAQLHSLREMGVRIAIDDFGTGYSSLLQLRTLPVDTLKVDRQFVDGLMRNADDAVIVSASISLALALRLRVVAEGVETPEQAEELLRLGCDLGQGFLWSRPLAAEDFAQWFAAAGAMVAAGPGQEPASVDAWVGEPVAEMDGYRSRHDRQTGEAAEEVSRTAVAPRERRRTSVAEAGVGRYGPTPGGSEGADAVQPDAEDLP